MTEKDILQIRDLSEQGLVQFKERALDTADITAEMVAMSNAHGGRIIIGINDKTGAINAMSYTELKETCETLGNLASTAVVPTILIETENVPVEGGAVTVATIKEGLNKPYKDSKGIVWVKNGSDKRKVFDNAELAEMMTDCGSFAPDEAAVRGATMADLDEYSIKLFLRNKYARRIDTLNLSDQDLEEISLPTLVSHIAAGLTPEKILRNIQLIRPDGSLTVTAMLLLGKTPQVWLPTFTCKCICFYGNSVGGKHFRDKVHDMDMEGNLLHQYECVMNFFRRNLRTVQVEEGFNTLGRLEIPADALQEFVVNAFVHRSLNWSAPVRIFIFDDRVEIHSPGILPSGLTVSDIKRGTSMPRNRFLFNNAIYSLPYTGAGSGIRRAIDSGVNVSMVSDEGLKEFIVTIPRSNQVASESNQVEENNNQVQAKSNQVEQERSNQVARPKVTKKQEDIINFCSVPRTAQEIMDRLGITNQQTNRERHITPLIEAGYLEPTNPDNPTASNQKYRRKTK